MRERRLVLPVLWALVAFVLFAVPADARGLWPQDGSDLKPDPGIKFGVLPNGLRYAIKINRNPEGTATLRLRVEGGSLHETDKEQGVAHFLEHMAFNGSTNYPEGEMFRALQRAGIGIGSNANAATDFDATTFSISLPSVRNDTLTFGFNIMREIAGRLTLSGDAINRERGVILSEERARDTPAVRANIDQLRALFPGQKYAERFPIGQTAFIRSAGPAELRSFYLRHYRPERSFLVVVGDVNVSMIEAKIAAVFSDWKPEGPGAGPENFGTVKARGLTVGHATQPGLEESVGISWIRPEDTRVDTLVRRRELHRRLVAFTVLNRRLSKVARQGDPPFIDARADTEVIQGAGIVTSISIRTRTGEWAKGLAAAEQEVRRALQYGLQQSEVDREGLEQRSPYLIFAANADTRLNGDVADLILESVGAGRVPTDPQTELALYTANTTGLKAADATAELKKAFSGAGPVVFVSSAEPIAGGDPAIRQAYVASTAVAVTKPAESTIKAFSYRDFGAKGTVAERKSDGEIDATLVRFANGVALNVKSTTFEKDKVSVVVRFGGGYLELPKKKGLGWALPFAFVEGGLGQLDIQELEQTEPGHFAGIDLSLDDDAFELSGETVQRDVLLQLQVLAAFFIDPAYRPDGLRRIQNAGEGQFREELSTPSGVLSRELPGILHSGDPRWAAASIDDVRAVTMDDVKAVMQRPLTQSPIEVTIVGHVKLEDAIEAAAKTFGAAKFTTRPKTLTLSEGARNVRFPAERENIELQHLGRPDQASVAAAWPGPDLFSDVRRERAIAVLNEILQLRLIDEVREKQGGTYTPFGFYDASRTIPGYGYLVAGVEPRPDAADLFFTTLDEITEELRTTTLTNDLLERARKPLLYQTYAAQSTNGYWVSSLKDIQADPRNLNRVRTTVDDYATITAAEVTAVAKQFLDDKRRVDVKVLPK